MPDLVLVKCMKCYDTLQIAIQQAGGNIIDISKMTAIELLAHIGPNDIVFKYEDPRLPVPYRNQNIL